MNASFSPFFGTTQPGSLSGVEPMDCSESIGLLADFENALNKQPVDIYLMNNPNIIEREVQHEFRKLNEPTTISGSSEYQEEFINFIIKKSKKLECLINNPACNDLNQATIFKQLVTAYTNQSPTTSHDRGQTMVYTSIPHNQRQKDMMSAINKPPYQQLEKSIFTELSRISDNSKSYLFHELKPESTSNNLQKSYTVADSIALSSSCPLHYFYIKFLFNLENHYKQQNINSAPPPAHGFCV